MSKKGFALFGQKACSLRRTRRRKKRITFDLPPAGGKLCEAFFDRTRPPAEAGGLGYLLRGDLLGFGGAHGPRPTECVPMEYPVGQGPRALPPESAILVGPRPYRPSQSPSVTALPEGEPSRGRRPRRAASARQVRGGGHFPIQSVIFLQNYTKCSAPGHQESCRAGPGRGISAPPRPVSYQNLLKSLKSFL